MKPDVTANTQAVQANCWTKCRDGVSVFRLLKRCPVVTRLSSTTRATPSHGHPLGAIAAYQYNLRPNCIVLGPTAVENVLPKFGLSGDTLGFAKIV